SPWVNDDTYHAPGMRFTQYTLHHTAAETLQAFASLIADGTISESALNSYGYRLLAKKQYPEAIAVLTRNVELYPKSSNTYDSLAEAYTTDGNTPPPIDTYQNELTLAPT